MFFASTKNKLRMFQGLHHRPQKCFDILFGKFGYLLKFIYRQNNFNLLIIYELKQTTQSMFIFFNNYFTDKKL